CPAGTRACPRDGKGGSGRGLAVHGNPRERSSPTSPPAVGAAGDVAPTPQRGPGQPREGPFGRGRLFPGRRPRLPGEEPSRSPGANRQAPGPGRTRLRPSPRYSRPPAAPRRAVGTRAVLVLFHVGEDSGVRGQRPSRLARSGPDLHPLCGAAPRLFPRL